MFSTNFNKPQKRLVSKPSTPKSIIGNLSSSSKPSEFKPSSNSSVLTKNNQYSKSNILSPISVRNIKIGCLNVRSIRNKLEFVTELLIEHSLDLFFICETWLHESEKDIILAGLPKNYYFIHCPRSEDPLTRGGGVAIIFKKCFSNFKILPHFQNNSSFETLVCTFHLSNKSITTTVVYCPVILELIQCSLMSLMNFCLLF